MEHANRLIHEKSPYLLQHARNPVDWYPWGPEALARARSEDRPVFLSVGYSTCHWCHVMERESFENEETARLLNESFVSIKVDREERPDIDMVYMSAVQQLSGRGGWPLSAFLLPDGRPFWGGTYFTPNRFRHLVSQGAAVYRERRAEVERTAREVTEAVARGFGPPAEVERPPLDSARDGLHPPPAGKPAPWGGPELVEGPPLDHNLLLRALEVLRDAFDDEHGGFGAAPKFPPHGALPLLFHEYRGAGEEGLLRMAARTLEAMALGGLHDHLGGGFHRYSSDAEWLLPHFEKMLYDNALLARAYVEAYELTQDDFYRDAAEATYAWAAREMTHGGGGFCSALDADTEGVEGKFYTWGRDEILEILGRDEGDLFSRVYSVEEEGNYRDEITQRKTGANILHLKRRRSELAAEPGAPPDLVKRTARSRERLLEARGRRARPHRDDKIITSWNGLMIASLAYAGRMLDEPRHIGAAQAAADFVLSNLRQDGKLLRRWRDGEAKHPGCLEDYAFLAYGLLELGETTDNLDWVELARELMEQALADFWDEGEGGFFYTAHDAEGLFVRPREAFDHPLPSANGVAAQVLVRLGALTGDKRYREFGERTLRALSPWMARAPQATGSLILAAEMWLTREA